MAKIMKFSGYYVDPNGDYPVESLKTVLGESFDLISKYIKIEEVDIGEWDDDNPLNYCNCPGSECKKYFEVLNHDYR